MASGIQRRETEEDPCATEDGGRRNRTDANYNATASADRVITFIYDPAVNYTLSRNTIDVT
jgi:hypothetical protein